MKLKYITTVFVSILLCSCGNQCEICEVLKDGQIIEKYVSCDEEGIKASKSICQEMAKLQDSECKCRTK